jgi:hypothetical protein
MTALLHKEVATEVDISSDEGTFTAIAAAYSVDRVGERIIPGAFGNTIQRWRASGKSLPLAWDHSRAAADLIGSSIPTPCARPTKGSTSRASSTSRTPSWRERRGVR